MDSCCLDGLSLLTLDFVNPESVALHQSLLQGLLPQALDLHREVARIGDGAVDLDGMLRGCKHERVRAIVGLNPFMRVLNGLKLNARPAA